MIHARSLLALLLAASLAACSHTAPPPAQQKTTQTVQAPYSAQDFYQTTSYGPADALGIAFSPDGKRVLVNSDANGVFNAYAVDIASGQQLPLSASTSNATFAVSYFPNDGRVLLQADEGGNELTHLYLREEDGQLHDLTPGAKVRASFLGWAKDNSSFYVLSNARDGKSMDLYRYTSNGFTLKSIANSTEQFRFDSSQFKQTRVFKNTDNFDISAVSPDGRWLALTKARTSADSDIYLADLKNNAAPKLITKHNGNVAHGVYDFAPDSQSLYYATDAHGEFAEAWAYHMASGKAVPRVKADWDVVFVAFSKSGRYQATGINEDAVTRVKLTTAADGKPVPLPALPAGELRGVRFSADEKQLAVLINSDTSPSNLFVIDLEKQTAKQLTQALSPKVAQSDLVEGEVVRFKSFDGLDIPAILYKPKQASADQKVPAVVWVHGGPGGQSTKGYSASLQHLINHGYAVLAVNNRGSSGYGKTFFHLDDKRHGEGDLQDVIYGRRYLESLNWVNGEKVGIMGGSYGGYMVAAALAFEPEAFNVGIDIFGVTNWVRTLKSIPPWWESFKEALYDEMGDPATDEARHRKISPLFHAKNIKKPLLVVQGKNDPRVLQVESDELVAAVRANQIPVEYLVFPDEGHGFQRKENRINASEAYLKFLDRHLR